MGLGMDHVYTFGQGNDREWLLASLESTVYTGEAIASPSKVYIQNRQMPKTFICKGINLSLSIKIFFLLMLQTQTHICVDIILKISFQSSNNLRT